MNALLLNADYSPLKIIPTKKAIRLVLKDKAEILETSDTTVRGEKLKIPEPRVLVLREYVYVPPKNNYAVSRKAILFRDRYTCAYCGRHATTIDHIKPRSKGGTHDWKNVVAACKPCNGKKADKFLKDIGWELQITPKTPSGAFWILIKARHIDPTWEPYLDG